MLSNSSLLPEANRVINPVFLFVLNHFEYLCQPEEKTLMNIEERIEAFAVLGLAMVDAAGGREGIYSDILIPLIERQQFHNPWFSPENVRMALDAIGRELTSENLKRWTLPYDLSQDPQEQYKVGVIMAGNIPLAGFHDFLSVLISGHAIVIKASSKDSELISALATALTTIDKRFGPAISFSEGTMKDFDRVIATGSNNSSRYFDYYFGRYPHIIRKNRNSVAVINGNESESEIEALGLDIFSYFGLGCRNVSKIYIPSEFDPLLLAKGWRRFAGIVMHSRYANNYDYNKAIYMVNKEPFSDTGFLLLRENSSIASPVAVLHYERTESQAEALERISFISDSVQCVVGQGFLPYGKAQFPHLWDYADGIDTLKFLQKK